MKLHRNESGLLRGDLEYDNGFPATVLPHITPILFPCTNCVGLTLHVTIEQPIGVGISIPFVRKPLATTGRDYGLICNECTCLSGISGKRIFELLQSRIAPPEVCMAVDKFCSGNPGAVPAFSEGFAAYIPNFCEDPDQVVTFTSVYVRPDF